MSKKRICEQAAELRRAYQREWRRKNRDKVKESNRRYWERKALRMAEEEATKKGVQ